MGLARALIRRDMLGVLDWLGQVEAPVVAPPLVPLRVVLDADVARQVLVTDADSYGRPWLVNNIMGEGLGRNLFTATGEEWSTRRRMVRAIKLSTRGGFHVNMLKSLFAGLVIVAAASAVADTINFDDLNGDGSHTIQNGYAGLNWDNVFIYDATHDPANLNPSGYQFSVISPNNVAFTGYGNPITVSSDTVFNLNSAYLTAVWKDNLQVKVIGSLLGAPIYVNTYSLSATAATPINFNYLESTACSLVFSMREPSTRDMAKVRTRLPSTT